jgi:REP element-mobilizing transposase RayT
MQLQRVLEKTVERFWFLTWTTYGTWLPGDDRGFVSNVREGAGPEVRHREPGQPFDRDLPALAADARLRLRGDPIRLSASHATQLSEQLHETAGFRGWTLIALAIMDNHVHMVVGVDGDPEPSALLRDFKSYGSRRLNREFGNPASGTWWTEGGSTRIVKGDLFAVLKYVGDQTDPLLVVQNESVIQLLFEPERASSLLVPHQGAYAPRSPVAEPA